MSLFHPDREFLQRISGWSPAIPPRPKMGATGAPRGAGGLPAATPRGFCPDGLDAKMLALGVSSPMAWYLPSCVAHGCSGWNKWSKNIPSELSITVRRIFCVDSVCKATAVLQSTGRKTLSYSNCRTATSQVLSLLIYKQLIEPSKASANLKLGTQNCGKVQLEKGRQRIGEQSSQGFDSIFCHAPCRPAGQYLRG